MVHCFLHSALRRIVPDKMDKWNEHDIHCPENQYPYYVQQLTSSVANGGNVFPLDI